MPRTIPCPADQWTIIFQHAFVQLPATWTLVFRAPDGAPIAGELRVKRSSWILPNPPELLPLQPVMHLRRGWWNTFFNVQVKPSHDLLADIRRGMVLP
jgi:hypothetical protein